MFLLPVVIHLMCLFWIKVLVICILIHWMQPFLTENCVFSAITWSDLISTLQCVCVFIKNRFKLKALLFLDTVSLPLSLYVVWLLVLKVQEQCWSLWPPQTSQCSGNDFTLCNPSLSPPSLLSSKPDSTHLPSRM